MIERMRIFFAPNAEPVREGYSPTAEWAILAASSPTGKGVPSLNDALLEMQERGWCVLGEEPHSLLVGRFLKSRGISCSPWQMSEQPNEEQIRTTTRQGGYVLLRRRSDVQACGVVANSQTSVALRQLESDSDRVVRYYDARSGLWVATNWDALNICCYSECWFVTPNAIVPERARIGLNPVLNTWRVLADNVRCTVRLCNEICKGWPLPAPSQCTRLCESRGLFEHLTQEKNSLHIAVRGGSKRGKSAFINALLGEIDLLPEHYRERTCIPVQVCPADCGGERREYRLVSESGGQEHVVDAEVAKKCMTAPEENISAVKVLCDSPLLKDLNLTITDTPAHDSLYIAAEKCCLGQEPYWDAVFYVVDSGESPLTDRDIREIAALETLGAATAIVQTANDMVSTQAGEAIWKANIYNLEKKNISCSLGYYRVDSASRVAAAAWKNVRDMQHSNYPRLLYALNTNLYSVCDAKHNKILKQIKSELESAIQEDLRTLAGFIETPCNLVNIDAALDEKRRLLLAKKKTFSAHLRSLYVIEELEKSLYKNLATAKTQEQMNAVLIQFYPKYQFNCFVSQIRCILTCPPSQVTSFVLTGDEIYGKKLGKVTMTLEEAICNMGDLSPVLELLWTPLVWISPLFSWCAKLMRLHLHPYKKKLCPVALKRKLCKLTCEELREKYWSDEKKFKDFEDQLQQCIDSSLEEERKLYESKRIEELKRNYSHWKDEFLFIKTRADE